MIDCVYVCKLTQQLDPSRTLKWSLSYDERCLCDEVVKASSYYSHIWPKETKFWYTDDDCYLTNSINWDKETLDILLNRTEYCGQGTFFIVLV